MVTTAQLKRDIRQAVIAEGEKPTPKILAEVYHNYMANGCHEVDLQDAIETTFDVNSRPIYFDG
jgi:hypothetical protein